MSSTENASPPMADQATSAVAHSPPGTNKKKRIRNWTADDRAAHRVFERSRREAFKERLITLAGLIPSLRSTDPNRLSKHVVIDQSVALHKAEQHRLAESFQRIDRLVAERDELLSELNTWRLNAGLEALPARVTVSESEATSVPILDEAGAAMLRTSASSIGATGEHSVAGSGPIYLEEQSSFVASEHDLTAEAAMASTAEPDPTPASMRMDIPWISTEMDYTIPGSLGMVTDFSAARAKSPSYRYLPMSYGTSTNNINDGNLRFNTTVMHMADPSSLHNNTYIYTG